MTKSNPPAERGHANNAAMDQDERAVLAKLRVDLTRICVRDHERVKEAEAISGESWRLLNRREPDPNRRALLWLVGRTFLDEPNDSSDPREGPRAMHAWISAMVAHAQPR